jgi:hypothetical protein
MGAGRGLALTSTSGVHMSGTIAKAMLGAELPNRRKKRKYGFGEI